MKSAQLKLDDPAVMWKAQRKPKPRKPYDGERQDLTRDEIDKLFGALKRNRNGHRDYMIGLVCFLHGLRVSELIDLRWDDIDWRAGTIRIRRLKGSHDGVHILERDEAAGLRRLQREQDPKRPHVFTSERGQAFTRFAINKMIEAAGRRAGIERALHPHCLRHTTGSALANGGMSAWHLQKHLGHANMSNTIGYVRMSPEPLKDVWRGRR